MLEQRADGEPIWVRTLSSHCRGPFKCSSIQQGVLVTVCRLENRDMMFCFFFNFRVLEKAKKKRYKD